MDALVERVITGRAREAIDLEDVDDRIVSQSVHQTKPAHSQTEGSTQLVNSLTPPLVKKGALPSDPPRSLTSLSQTSVGDHPTNASCPAWGSVVQYDRKVKRKAHPLEERLVALDPWPAPRPSVRHGRVLAPVPAHVLGHTLNSGRQRKGSSDGVAESHDEPLQWTQAAVPELLESVLREVENKLQKLRRHFPEESRHFVDVMPPLPVDTAAAITGGWNRQHTDVPAPSPAPSPIPQISDAPSSHHPAETREIAMAETSQTSLPSNDRSLIAAGTTPSQRTTTNERGAWGKLDFATSISPVSGTSPLPKRGPVVGFVPGMKKNVIQDARSLVARQGPKVESTVALKPSVGGRSTALPAITATKTTAMRRSGEDLYRADRLAIFEAAGLDFANHFHTYRGLLHWIFSEFRSFVRYCHRHVVSPQMKAQFESDLRQQLVQEYADERARMTFERDQLKASLDDISAKYQQSRAISLTAEKRLADKDAIIVARDAEIAESNEGRVAMLSRINRLEKELWAQRDALEGPEAIIATLRKELRVCEDRLLLTTKALEEANQDKAVLKLRLERLEEILKERKVRQAQMVPKSELVLYKKAQIDILELNANLEAKLLKLRGAYRSLMDEMQRLKSNIPGTPRPPWHLADDVFPPASTTAQRVHLAMREYRHMMLNNQILQREVDTLRATVAAMPRTNENDANEYVLPEMRMVYFYKMGFDSSVPPYLRGRGRAYNLNLTLEQTGGYCRQWFLHRDTVKFGASHEGIFESFCQKHGPTSVSSQDFAYSFVHAMRWFSFDPFIGMMREYLADAIDETILARLEKLIIGCRLFVQTSVEALGLGKGGGGDAAASPSPRLLGEGQANVELVRRKSLSKLLDAPPAENLNAAEVAEDAAAKLIATGNATFSSLCLKVDEPQLLYKTEILPLIADFFSYKSEEELKALVGQLSLDYPGIQVDALALFRFNGQKKRFSAFVEEIIRQEQRFHHEMVRDTISAIQANTNTDGHVSPNDIAQSLWKMDPLIPAAYMDELLADLFEVGIEELHPRIKPGSYYKTPGLDGERVYEENEEEPLVAEEGAIVARVKRRYLQRFCPKAEAETERLRLEKEAERAKERAELDF